MKKNEDRKLAEEVFLQERGRITNKELAHTLGVHPATVARWKRIDEWDVKLVQQLTSQGDQTLEETDFYQVDLRHLKALNDRIDAYLQKKDLLTLEILQLAEAKYHIMSCMEFINDELRFPFMHEQDQDEEQFD